MMRRSPPTLKAIAGRIAVWPAVRRNWPMGKAGRWYRGWQLVGLAKISKKVVGKATFLDATMSN